MADIKDIQARIIPGDRVYVFDMYGGIVESVVISQEEYQKRSHKRGTGGATLTYKGSLPLVNSRTKIISVCPKSEMFSTYNEALAYKVMNT